MTWRDDVARWALFVSIALLLGVVGIRLLVLPRIGRRAGRAARPRARHGGRRARAQRRDRRLRDPLRERAPGVGRRPALRRPLAVRRGDALRDRLPRHDARVRRLPDDPRRSRGCSTGRGSAGPRSCSPSRSSGATRSRGTRRPSRTHRVLGQVADWVHLVTAMLWVGGVLTLAVVVWPLAPDLRRAAFLRFSRIAIGLVGVLVVAGTVVAIERLPDRLRPLGDELRPDAARQARRSSPWRSHGAGSTTRSCGRASSAARRRGGSAAACSARAPSRWRSCSSRPSS